MKLKLCQRDNNRLNSRVLESRKYFLISLLTANIDMGQYYYTEIRSLSNRSLASTKLVQE